MAIQTTVKFTEREMRTIEAGLYLFDRLYEDPDFADQVPTKIVDEAFSVACGVTRGKATTPPLDDIENESLRERLGLAVRLLAIKVAA